MDLQSCVFSDQFLFITGTDWQSVHVADNRQWLDSPGKSLIRDEAVFWYDTNDRVEKIVVYQRPTR